LRCDKRAGKPVEDWHTTPLEPNDRHLPPLLEQQIEKYACYELELCGVADYQPHVEAFTLGKPVIQRLNGIEELQDEHFFVEAEKTAAD
jgi:hypothetical protein